FCEKIKTTIDTSHIPVILLTERTDNEIKYRGLEMGADDYISKPFEIDYLSIKVKNLIASREHLRNLFQNNIMLEPSKVTVTSIDEKFLKSLMVEIEKGITNPEFTIEFLEKEMGMSHSKLYRKIKSITGQSGKELLQDMRLKRAAQLITDNKKISVADLTDMVGFSDPKHFSACFKQKFGVPPSEY
ncbi:MAG: helix-turn-helix domain-containing protein, partial [Lentimicrobium sp.]|nr:helix-turn-helix domain-containing protein [Lentimicrobium sp.]